MMPTFEKFTKYGYKPTNLTNKRAKDANSVKVGSEAQMVPDAILAHMRWHTGHTPTCLPVRKS